MTNEQKSLDELLATTPSTKNTTELDAELDAAAEYVRSGKRARTPKKKAAPKKRTPAKPGMGSGAELLEPVKRGKKSATKTPAPKKTDELTPAEASRRALMAGLDQIRKNPGDADAVQALLAGEPPEYLSSYFDRVVSAQLPIPPRSTTYALTDAESLLAVRLLRAINAIGALSDELLATVEARVRAENGGAR